MITISMFTQINSRFLPNEWLFEQYLNVEKLDTK